METGIEFDVVLSMNVQRPSTNHTMHTHQPPPPPRGKKVRAFVVLWSSRCCRRQVSGVKYQVVKKPFMQHSRCFLLFCVRVGGLVIWW